MEQELERRIETQLICIQHDHYIKNQKYSKDILMVLIRKLFNWYIRSV